MDTRLSLLMCGNGNGNGTKEPRASRLGIHVLISGGPHIACDIIFYAHFSVGSHSAAGAHMREPAPAPSAALCGAQFAWSKFPARKGQCGETRGMGGAGITGI